MDAFFTIAPPVPADATETVEDILVDAESVGSSGNHGSCVIA
ncbi:pheromone [Trametes versicolor FP-101664 SS1]|nr:pheromone [Trametes versicolor FP-101664 SS1]EIW57107.1 pheromone [Trametes versicolor FP-101664 SS1]